MYRFLRPIFFLFSPEAVHGIVMVMLRTMGHIPGAKWLLGKCLTVKSDKLHVNVLGIDFPNPVGLAAGFDKNAVAIREIAALGFGFVEIGSVTPVAQFGNPKPRCFRLSQDKAIINRMGFNNNGVDAVANLLSYRKAGQIIGGNIGKNTLTSNGKAADDYLSCFISLYDVVDYFVVNVSCPNVSNLRELQDHSQLTEIVQKLTAHRAAQNHYKAILLKVSPDISFEQVDVMLAVIGNHGLDGIVATNTTTSRGGLTTRHQEVEAIGNGGLSGAPLTARSLDMVKYISAKTGGKLPIIGVGGIMSVEDALNMLNAGASLIQVYTGFIYNGPGFVKKICRAILNKEQGQKEQRTRIKGTKTTSLSCPCS
ncbi:MAG: quinone-dependent dihydroorotate dehydrogenase [Prevotellaceae bacterium]|jgi:dihydroorotate dehydrogenase|nr:quinone-dependent dihydroorotate dehydrogenase [Prevotellaceae bacterium]